MAVTLTGNAPGGRRRLVVSRLVATLLVAAQATQLLYCPAYGDDSVSTDPKASLAPGKDDQVKDPSLPPDNRPPGKSDLDKSDAPTTENQLIDGQNKSSSSNTPTFTGMVQAFNDSFKLSPRAAAIRAQLPVAESNMAEAFTFPNPSFVIDDGFRAEQTYRMGANVVVESPFKLLTRIQMTRRQITQQDLQNQLEMWLLREAVRKAYVNLTVSQETYNILDELVHDARILVRAAKSRTGSPSGASDLSRAQLALAECEIEYKNAHYLLTDASQQLNVVMGKDADQEVHVPRLPPFKLQANTSDLLPDVNRNIKPASHWLEEAFKSRLELKVLEQSMRATKAGLSNAVANILPDAHFSVGRSMTKNPPNGPRLHGWFFILEQEVPVFDFQQGPIAKYRATYKQLQQEMSAQKNLITAQVLEAYQMLSAARERVKSYQSDVLDLADNARIVTLNDYQNGRVDLTAALSAQQANLQTRTRYLDAVRAYQQSFTDLEQAVGVPLQ